MKVTISFQPCDNYRGQIYVALWLTVVDSNGKNKDKLAFGSYTKPTARKIRKFKKRANRMVNGESNG